MPLRFEAQWTLYSPNNSSASFQEYLDGVMEMLAIRRFWQHILQTCGYFFFIIRKTFVGMYCRSGQSTANWTEHKSCSLALQYKWVNSVLDEKVLVSPKCKHNLLKQAHHPTLSSITEVMWSKAGCAATIECFYSMTENVWKLQWKCSRKTKAIPQENSLKIKLNNKILKYELRLDPTWDEGPFWN